MNRDRFEGLYAEHAEPLLGFLVYRTGDRPLAEEVLADTFERALRSRTRFDPRRANVKTWLYAIALNRLKDLHRKQDAERRALLRERAALSESTPDPTWIEDRADLHTALADLDEPEREAIALRYGADLSVPEVATLLKINLSTAEGRIYRGLKKLRVALEEEPVRPSDDSDMPVVNLVTNR